jgi:hypothetical protein
MINALHFDVSENSPRDQEIVEGCKPYFTAIGVDTSKWAANELYELESMITDDPEVWKLAKLAASLAHTSVVDILAAVRALSPQKKAAIRRCVLQKMAAKRA